MKFGRQYTKFMNSEAQRLPPDCPYVEFKAFKKLLRRCPHVAGPAGSSRQRKASVADFEGNDECSGRRSENFNVASSVEFDHNSSASRATSAVQDRARIMEPDEDRERDEDMEPYEDNENRAVAAGTDNETTSSPCSVCDEEFFSNLDKAVSAVVGCFNVKARELLRLHNASSLRRTLLRLTSKARGDRASMLQLGNMLVNYGCMNAIAVRKILKKYDKTHGSANGQAFKTRLQVKRLELLQSPLLIEVGALAVNIMDSHVFRPLRNPQPQGLSSPCSFDDKNQAITCVLRDGMKVEFDLTCSICLEVVFDPVTLGCGHIFCNSCACAAASVPVFHGVTSAKRSTKCALCRQAGVYLHATSMRELWILVKHRCSSYYAERLVVERRQRVREAKVYWEGQTQRICTRER